MPIYEYQCNACEHKFETLQKISEDPLTQCPECQESTLKKLISAPAFRLKGGGWYETDFKTGDKKNVAQSDKKENKSSSKDAGSKSGNTKSASTSSKKKTGSAG